MAKYWDCVVDAAKDGATSILISMVAGMGLILLACYFVKVGVFLMNGDYISATFIMFATAILVLLVAGRFGAIKR